ncbi:putative serine esterase-domain-containing protein [Scheffersomyces coipomensis]|uniref:putative serine esterase-domain-containing protein n=1 Tax=Scheffersomyces coipomensis TaxID=1788519 RepID=UPI00315C6AFA
MSRRSSLTPSEPSLWYRDKQILKIGQVNRYTITVERQDSDIDQIYLRLKNIERPPIRAFHLLNGPFILYCHIVPYNYNYQQRFIPDDIENSKEIQFNHDIKPGETFKGILRMNENSHVKDNIFQWEVDIISQIVITDKTNISYDLVIGRDMQMLKKLHHMNSLQNTLTTLSTNIINDNGVKLEDGNIELEKSIHPHLTVVKQDTRQLWDIKPKYPTKPVHLIILTHGIFSNLTADMLYVRDTLLNTSNENIIIKGYEGNAGKTEKGVKKLGKNMGKYLINYIENECPFKIEKVSFIGHSLGGLVQLYAIRYILLIKGPKWFDQYGLIPHNLIFLASPLLGILNEISFFLSWFLDLGTLGKTGRDLTLSKRKFPTSSSSAETSDDLSMKPVLELLPDFPLHEFLTRFKHLTIYANAINDGIVPLRTAALLYLDYEALGDVKELKHHKSIKSSNQSLHHSIETNNTIDTVTEVPEDGDDDDAKEKKSKGRGLIGLYKQIINLNLGKSAKINPTRKLTNREKRYLKINSKGIDTIDMNHDDNNTNQSLTGSTSSSNDSSNNLTNNTSTTTARIESTTPTNITLNIPPRANVVESAINTILCPIPSTKFIMDPNSRDDVIFHDKYYKFENIPQHEDEQQNHQQSEDKKVQFTWSLINHDWKLKKQVKIARKYHTDKLNWRKILVNLPPDAHNNIIVRRRFANGYGWGVIDHLCSNLFMDGEEEVEVDTEKEVEDDEEEVLLDDKENEIENKDLVKAKM